jgi:L-lysine 2,3-aminomutase
MQHKYCETVLFFPAQGQTCHAYCSFCFRWPQFVGPSGLKFAMNEVSLLIRYLQEHPEVTDVLFTGGDPMVMSAKLFRGYLMPLLDACLPSLRTIRIGSKALSYWPYRFTSDPDSEDLLNLFREVEKRGKHLAFMAHFNHPRELGTEAVRQAIAAIRATGAQIRSQSPVLSHINADPETWITMWTEQVRLGIIPYYMFVMRDTGAQHFFGVPLAQAHAIFKAAYQSMSGIARTVRGPVMSVNQGKVQLLGLEQAAGEDVMVMQFIQARDPEWNLRPFFAKRDANALWFDELVPAFGKQKYFYEKEK